MGGTAQFLVNQTIENTNKNKIGNNIAYKLLSHDKHLIAEAIPRNVSYKTEQI